MITHDSLPLDVHRGQRLVSGVAGILFECSGIQGSASLTGNRKFIRPTGLRNFLTPCWVREYILFARVRSTSGFPGQTPAPVAQEGVAPGAARD
jgi:hypothetical protein